MYNVEVKYNKEDLVDRIIITHKWWFKNIVWRCMYGIIW
jgi:hypothetical protein